MQKNLHLIFPNDQNFRGFIIADESVSKEKIWACLPCQLRQLKFLSHYNDYNFNFSNYWLEFYIICTFFKFSASPHLRVIVPHYKKKKRGGGILSSLLISEFWSKSLSLPLSLSVSPSSVLHYIMVYEMPAGLGAAGSVSNYELDAISGALWGILLY